MAEPELFIELEGGNATFRAGETVRGDIVVANCQGIENLWLGVDCVWFMENKLRLATNGNSRSGAMIEGAHEKGEPKMVELLGGSSITDTAERLPFEMPLPLGPFNYRGQLFDFRWCLLVRAQNGKWGSTRAEAEEEIEILPDPERPVDPLAGYVYAAPAFLREGQPQGLKIPFPEGTRAYEAFELSLFLAVLTFAVAVPGGVLWYFTRWGFWDDPVGMVLGVAGLIAAVVVPARPVIWALRKLFARRKIGNVKVDIEPRVVRPGETTRIEITCPAPRQDAELSHATISLVGKERITSRGNVTEHELHRETLEMPGCQLRARLPIELEASLMVPEPATPSFSTGRYEVVWNVEAAISLPKWPDWTAEKEIVVVPGR